MQWNRQQRPARRTRLRRFGHARGWERTRHMAKRITPAENEATGKRRLLQKLLEVQTAKLGDANRRHDKADVDAIMRRMQHVRHLIADLEGGK